MKMGPEPDPAVDSGTFTLYSIALSPGGVKVWTWPSAWLKTARHQQRQYTISIVSEYWSSLVHPMTIHEDNL